MNSQCVFLFGQGRPLPEAGGARSEGAESVCGFIAREPRGSAAVVEEPEWSFAGLRVVLTQFRKGKRAAG